MKATKAATKATSKSSSKAKSTPKAKKTLSAADRSAIAKKAAHAAWRTMNSKAYQRDKSKNHAKFFAARRAAA